MGLMLGNQLLTLIKKSTIYVANKPKHWYQGQVNVLIYCVPGKHKWWWILHVSNLKKAHLSISFLEIFFGDSWARILSLFFNFKSFMLSITIWFLYTQKVITITSLVVTYHHTVDPLHHLSASSALSPLASSNHQLFTVSMRALFVCLPCLLICFFFFFLSPHVSEIIWHLSFFTWPISFSIILSRSIHVVTNVRLEFYFMTEYYICIYLISFYLFSYWLALRLFPYLG